MGLQHIFDSGELVSVYPALGLELGYSRFERGYPGVLLHVCPNPAPACSSAWSSSFADRAVMGWSALCSQWHKGETPNNPWLSTASSDETPIAKGG